MKKQIEENQSVTANSKQAAILKQHFPNCFDKEGKFLPTKLEEIMRAEGADITREGYSLNWLGKSYARLLANLHTETLLAANIKHNAKDENKNSENLLIQGDNLDVLKHLKNAYGEKVKMIYIDPPYNTGSDGFVYADDRKFTAEELSSLAGIDEDEAKRILEFTRSKSNSHSAWLTFMFPRLYIARELLREDGVIFISVDDNEQAQLKMLCDEVFGEENFFGNFIWQNKKGGGNDSKFCAIEHEYVLAYARNTSVLDRLFENYSKEYLKRYKEQDQTSKYFWDTFKRKSGKQYYAIECPDGTFLEDDDYGNPISWLRSEDRYKADKKIGDVKFEQRGQGYSIMFKQRLPKGKKPRSLILDRGTTADGSATILDLFKKNMFSNPKPVGLIEFFAGIMLTDREVVLDFFAGSGTTTHAVMQLNAEDGGNRKYICVQLDEQTAAKSEASKAGYKTIFDITRKRITLAAAKIKSEHPDAKCDFGFKEFRTIPAFENYLDMAETSEQFDMFDADKLSDEQRNQLMLTWQVYDGLPLHLDLTPVEFAPRGSKKYTAYQGEHIIYFLDQNLALDHITELLDRIDNDPKFAPRKLVVFAYILSSKAQREISEAVKNYNNRKQIELHLQLRF